MNHICSYVNVYNQNNNEIHVQNLSDVVVTLLSPIVVKHLTLDKNTKHYY